MTRGQAAFEAFWDGITPELAGQPREWMWETSKLRERWEAAGRAAAEVTAEALALALSRMHVTVGEPTLCDPDREVPGGSAQGIPLYPEPLARMLLADIAGQEATEGPCDLCGERRPAGLLKRVLIGGEWIWTCTDKEQTHG